MAAKKVEEKVIINWRLEEWFPDIPADTMALLKQFHEELLKFNKTINLISAATIPNADLVHVADSVMGAQSLLASTQCDEIYDLGSGNGLPGVVIAIMAPDRKVICVERDKRKAEYLKHCAFALGLKNMEVKAVAIESLGDGVVSCGISRGFASISKAILATRKIFAKDGEYYHMKGDTWGRELAEIPSQLCSFWSPSLFSQYSLPTKTEVRAIVLTKKIGI